MANSWAAHRELSRMKWLIKSGFLLTLLLVDRGRADEDLVVAPNPGDDGNAEDDISIKYDMYNSSINICENVADEVYLPYVDDCDKYIECQNGKIAKIGSCLELERATPTLCLEEGKSCNLGFDPVFQVCTYRSKVQCLPTCESFALSSFCYDNTCTKYVLCYYGRPVLRQCHDQLQYNNMTDRCDFPQFVDCVANDCSATNNPNNITYIASKASCSKYFVCSNGRPWEQECSAGLLYNPECQCCDYAKNVECSIDATARNIKPYSRSPLRRADIQCPQVGIHFYPHKYRQDAYYYCVDGRGVTLDCTPGLHYDPKVAECREPQNVGL
ncbi:probable chitinase 10 [Drosophila kikkawai]|uniref:Probable chitinase 10 n=1 Tax=Drosophila kikkawai TaxID=30033 RepID=A0A6P4HW39_DROKI|nr:probable chitinase 10 [Drosophila kikkawai]